MQNNKKERWKYIFLLLVMIIVLTSFRMVWLMYHAPSEQVSIQNGVLDLRGSQLEEEAILLNGEWLYFPERLLDPQQGNFDADLSGETQESAGEDSSARFGTYYLKILLDERRDPHDIYSVRIPGTSTASKLYVNDRLQGESGVVAGNQQNHEGKGNPYTVSFTTEENEINLILQISNFDTSKEIAIKNPIKFGTSEAIAKEQDFAKVLLVSMVVILLLHSLYCILIYLFIYRTKLLLFFAVGFLLPAIDELVTYNSGALEWLHLNYAWSFKFKELVYLGAAFFLVQIMRVLLTNFEKYRQFRWFTVAYAVCAVLILVLPLSLLAEINNAFFVLYFVSFLSVVPLALREYFQKRDESIFIALVVISTTSGILWGLIKSVTGWVIPFYPFDYLCAFTGFAIFWFKRFHRQNQQVVQLVDELRQADKLKDDFLINSTNKLLNPLNKMTTIAKMLYEQADNSMTTKYKSDLHYLINIGRSMSYVLNDLLDFTRLKEQTLKVYPKSTSVLAVMSVVFDLLRYLSEGKQIELKSTVPADCPNVLADESRLIQILLNILGNAVKFTDSGEIIVHTEVRDEMVTIYVQDTGIGMDEEIQRTLTAAYQQGVKDEQGLGIGMAVSEKLIKLHGGSLAMESTLGEGTVFAISLPIAQESDGVGGGAVTLVEPDNQEKLELLDGENRSNILVVDDDPSNLRVIASVFPSDRYHVATATSGEKALALLNDVEWDLLVVDTLMPNMSGFELTELVRKRYSLLDLPILLLTIRSDITEINVGFSIGANDYVAKPINSLELKYRCDALIHLKKSISEKYYMEAAWLQAQIRPHFIFNTLNTIASLSTEDFDRMVTLLSTFGEYLSMSFKEENLQQLIFLHEELELVKAYLYIEGERFGERIQVKWEVEEGIDVQVPPLSIQTVVENAVHHGILKKEANGTIRIKVAEEEDCTKIFIIDDGVGMSEELIKKVFEDRNRIGKGVGLYNTNRRLERIYGTGLTIHSSLNNGTTVQFTIPNQRF